MIIVTAQSSGMSQTSGPSIRLYYAISFCFRDGSSAPEPNFLEFEKTGPSDY